MLPIYDDLAESAFKKINKNIYYMIELFLSSCEGLDYETFLEEIFPPFYLHNNIEVCKNIVMELKEITRDSFKRNYLKPIFEYALYMLFEWWIDVNDDIELLEKIEPDDVYTDEKEMVEFYNDVENYKAILFEDWDFLDIPEFFERYKENPKICTEIFHIDMDEYVDLMPNDIKEEYLLLRSKKEIVVEKDILTDDETSIINLIYNQLQLLTMRANFIEKRKVSENELSDFICDGLKLCFSKMGLFIEREVRAGYSTTELGELDFYIYKFDNGIYKQIAVGENKEWGKFEKSLKQAMGYMNEYTQFGFTIIYNKETYLDTVIKSRLHILKNFHVEGSFSIVNEPEEITDMINVVKTIHEAPEYKDVKFRFYHFIFNIHRPERKLSAKTARENNA